MNLEDDLHNIAPALDRAIDEAAAGVTRPAVPVPARDPWSRRRAAVVTVLAAAAIAAIVGVVARLDTGDRHGIGTTDSSEVSSPSDAPTTTSTTTEPTTTVAPATTTTDGGVALESVDWAAVVYPMAPDCGHVFSPPVTVGQVAYAAPAPGVQVAVVLVRCTNGAGTPPVSVFVYDGAVSTGSPHLAATLVADSDEWQASDFSVHRATIDLPVSGFSSSSLPNCCPDVHATLEWRWSDAGYRLVSPVPAHLTLQQYLGGAS